MSDLWCPFAERKDGHPSKQGYTGAESPPGSPKHGVVYHTAEGWADTLLGMVQDINRRASWQFSVLRDGTLWQHYPVFANTWHSGDVSRDDNVDIEGMLAGNLDLVGVEFEGINGMPGPRLTEPQYQTGLRLYRWLAEVCKFPPPSRTGAWYEKTLWEHREVSGTSCWIPYDRLLEDLTVKTLDREQYIAICKAEDEHAATAKRRVRQWLFAMMGWAWEE